MTKIPRRHFLKGLGTLLFLSGCQANEIIPPTSPAMPPTATLAPTPTISLNAHIIAESYFAAWAKGDYETMFNLLTPDSRILLKTPAKFANYYQAALNAATTQQVKTQLQSLLYKDNQAEVGFEVTWQTTLFGNIQADNQMRLRYNAGNWGVEWQPTLILPQLGEDVQLSFLREPQPARGNIYDRKLHALATQGQMITVGVIPQQMQNQEVALRHLASITGADPKKMREDIIKARPDWFVPIAEINFDTSVKYDELFNKIPGVDRRAHQIRAYSDGMIAAHILGYMGPISSDQMAAYQAKGYQGDELIGLMGVEQWAEAQLAGQRGGRLVTLAPSREVLSEIATVKAEAGSSLYLTIDTLFQAQVEQLLGDRVGSIVVMNPQNGTIHALASSPRFTPTVFTAGFDTQAWLKQYTTETRPLINRATQGLYPPASIFKIVSMTAALEALQLNPNDTFSCNGRWLGLGKDFPKKCWLENGHGQISLFDGLTQSCDVVFYEVGLALHRADPTLLPTWARRFGLGVPTTMVELAESMGVVPDDAWTKATFGQPYFDGDAVNSAIGQGYMLATPLQITRLLAAIANGGKLIQPRLADRILSVDGQEQKLPLTASESLPISAENLNLIQRSLAEVVSGAQGTARTAFVGFSESVAGKTGTAESGQEKPHAWFTGYAPVDNPRVVITVLLEYAGEGSQEAAPLFRQVAEAFFAWEKS